MNNTTLVMCVALEHALCLMSRIGKRSETGPLAAMVAEGDSNSWRSGAES
jgi:hypothetical protein